MKKHKQINMSVSNLFIYSTLKTTNAGASQFSQELLLKQM